MGHKSVFGSFQQNSKLMLKICVRHILLLLSNQNQWIEVKRSNTLKEVKPVENVSRYLQGFLEISPVQKSFFNINCETMHMNTRIFSDKRKIISHGEIVSINWIIQVCLTLSKNVRRVSFKERFAISKIWMKASTIRKPKL